LRVNKYDEKQTARLLSLADDSRIRNFIEYFDQGLARSQDRAQARNWKSIGLVEPFIEDAVNFGGFDSIREDELRQALSLAATEGDSPEHVQARATSFKLLSDARQAAVKTARGYRQLVDLLRRDLESREQVKNIGLVVEVRTVNRQPTLSPLSMVSMECASGPRPQKLVFSLRRRTCNDFGVCRVESSADIAKGGVEYQAVFDKLATEGRAYLDGCAILTTMLVDGAEISRKLPGRFTSHVEPALLP